MHLRDSRLQVICVRERSLQFLRLSPEGNLEKTVSCILRISEGMYAILSDYH